MFAQADVRWVHGKGVPDAVDSGVRLVRYGHHPLRRIVVKVRSLVAAGAAALAIPTMSVAPAQAAPTESAILRCGAVEWQVTGFGRGTPLKLQTDNVNFVVKYARLEPSGQVVLDKTGRGYDPYLQTCTTTSPAGQAYVFQGFFTPRR
jgi:hypothetical protein